MHDFRTAYCHGRQQSYTSCSTLIRRRRKHHGIPCRKRDLSRRRYRRRSPEYEISCVITEKGKLWENLGRSANSSSTDLDSRTWDRRCVHLTPEGNLYQQLYDSPPTYRKQQGQHQEKCKTWTISHMDLMATLESIFQRLTWRT